MSVIQTEFSRSMSLCNALRILVHLLCQLRLYSSERARMTVCEDVSQKTSHNCTTYPINETPQKSKKIKLLTSQRRKVKLESDLQRNKMRVNLKASNKEGV